MPTVEAPMTGAELTAALRGLSRHYWGTHPFHRRLHAGELTEAEFRLWAANRWYYQSVLPRKDAAIIANCPISEIRRQWLPRIVYHDGDPAPTPLRGAGGPGPPPPDGDGGGRERWLRLCEAAGLTRAEVLDERHVVPGVRFAVDAYVTFARTRAWLEAIASSLTEMFAGHLMRQRVADMLANYPWIRRDDLDYFTNRIDAVSGEGKDTVEIVVRYAVTRAQQEAAISALSFKCDVLWSMLDAIERAALKE